MTDVRKLVGLMVAALLALSPPVLGQSYIGGGTGVPENTAGYQKWMMFSDAVKEQSDGTLEITPIISGALGSEESILSSVRRGRVQVAIISSMVVASVVPEALLLQMPYLFDSQEEADYILDTILFDTYSELLADKGLTLLSWDEVGFHQVYGTAPLLTPDQATDVRFRVSSSPAARLFAEAIGADTISLPFSDLIMGLQTSLVSAGENAIILYAQTGVSELAPHLTMTNHSFAVNFLIAGKNWLEGLSAEHQQVVRTSWPPMSLGREMTRAEWTRDLQRASELGFTVHHLSDEQREVWRSAVAPAQAELVKLSGSNTEEVLGDVRRGQAAFRARTSVE